MVVNVEDCAILYFALPSVAWLITKVHRLSFTPLALVQRYHPPYSYGSHSQSGLIGDGQSKGKFRGIRT